MSHTWQNFRSKSAKIDSTQSEEEASWLTQETSSTDYRDSAWKARGSILTVGCQLWTGLLFWKPMNTRGTVLPGDRETQILISPNPRLSLSTFYAFLTQIKHFKEWRFSGWHTSRKWTQRVTAFWNWGCGGRERSKTGKELHNHKLSVLWGSSWDKAILGWARVWGMKDLPSRKDEMECATAAFAKWGL